jgi:hypothetical protein
MGPTPLISPSAARIISGEKSSCVVGALLEGHDYIKCTDSVRVYKPSDVDRRDVVRFHVN